MYSIAEDRVGNREPVKIKPDLLLNFNMPPTDILMSDTTFQDDVETGGYISEFSSVDTEEGDTFVYSLVEGDGAIHNDMFAIIDNRLHANDCFKCCDDSVFHIRVSTTDVGGLAFSKHFELSMSSVYERPEPNSISVNICEDDIFVFRDKEYDKAGIYYYRKSNEQMCDSVYVIEVTVSPILDKPDVSVVGGATLRSSYETGNQWFKDGEPVKDATGQDFTPAEDGVYYVATSNGACFSEPSDACRVKLSDDFVLELDIKEGWNWVSSNLADEKHKIVKHKEVTVQLDTTYWGRNFGLMVIKDVLRNEILWHKYVRNETIAQYVEGISWLEQNGFKIYGAVIDGMRGLAQALYPIPVQMCQFHQILITRRYLTQEPDLDASCELLEQVKNITKMDKEGFVGAFNEWQEKFKDVLNERVQDKRIKRYTPPYMRPRLRSAYLSLKRNMSLLWTFYDHPETGLPNTNNALEGVFSDLKSKVRAHRGISKENRKKLFDEYIMRHY